MVDRIISEFLDSNVFVVSKNNSCVIVDAGAKVEDVIKVVAGNKVVAVLLTHGHYDHCVYALDYAKKFDCKIYCSGLAKEYLADGEKNYSEGNFFINDFSRFVFLKDYGKISLGEGEIEYQQLGGHSTGDMIYKIGDNIFVGDLLIGRDIGRIDLYGGSKEKMKDALVKLQEQKYSVMFSGHGPKNDKETQDKVCALWQRFLSRQ